MNKLNRLKSMVLGMCMMISSVVSVQGKDGAFLEDPVVAKVNEYEIRLSYLYEKIEAIPLGEQIDVREQMPRFLDSVLQEEILFQSVLLNDFIEEPELRERLKEVVVEYLAQKYVHSKIRITDEQIQQYYQEHTSEIRGEHVQVRQILLKERTECEALMPQIDSESDFSLKASLQSLDPESAKDGGNLGYFMQHPGPLGFEEEFFEMKLGEMRIFESEQGCHLIRLVGKLTPPVPSLEEVIDSVRFVIRRTQEIQLLRQLIEQRSESLKIERFPNRLP